MGAYYHIFAPIKILVVVSKEKIENDNFLSFLPEKYRDDFILSHRQDYTQSSPIVWIWLNTNYIRVKAILTALAMLLKILITLL